MSSAILTSGGLATAGAFTVSKAAPVKKGQVLHHVFFWLKNPESKEDLKKLLDGLKSLEKIEAVKQYNIGVPAPTAPRPVIDSSYSVSALSVFDNLEGQNAYQVHPLHKKFVETCSPLWSRIQVYDSTDL
ncbi:Dabb family protein [Larkinella sp. GY13]|uniref:Dabb family protein n=1 Tax=Larkinella sp. GY13 TaxID=3453720 RepID=UPI003EE93D85